MTERSGNQMEDADETSHELLDHEATTPEIAPDASEADALEQASEVDGPEAEPPASLPDYVDEADALEQAAEVRDGEDDYGHA